MRTHRTKYAESPVAYNKFMGYGANRTRSVRYFIFFFLFPFSQIILTAVSGSPDGQIDMLRNAVETQKSKTRVSSACLPSHFISFLFNYKFYARYFVIHCGFVFSIFVSLRQTPIYIEKYQHDSETFIQTYNINCLTCDEFFFSSVIYT